MNLFYIAIGVGLAIPLLNLLLGFVDSIEPDLPIPLNILCLCLSFVVYGAIGLALTHYIPNPYPFLIPIPPAVAAYFFLYKYVVKPLRKNNPKALSQWDLIAHKGKLTLRIAEDSPGVVSVKDSTGAAISYRAYAKEEVLKTWGGEIPTGAEVFIIGAEPDSDLLYVKPFETFDNFKLKEKSQC
jgi:membrane protein implicated in regulation of membrane protease activity